jgi:hypothetical protein
MRKSGKFSWQCVGLFLAVASAPALAGFSTYGLGMDVQTGSVANGALHVQVANNLWSGTSGSGSPTNTYTNNFPGVACDDYAKAWLVTTIYGGSNLNTAKITATINGNTVGLLTVGNAGGVNDANTNVYGSSVAGIWVLSLPVNPSYLHKDGSADAVSVVVSDKTTGATSPFDGRTYYQALVTISQSTSLNNTLDYAFAAGGGDIGQTSGGYVTSRTLNMGYLSNTTISQADLYAAYIYGDAGQGDALLLNGTSLLGSDVANKNGTATYPADFVHASLAASNLVSTNNLLKFTVDAADVSSGESSLRPELAVLAVSHPVPEPASLAVLALGGMALLAKRRHRA